MQAALIATLPLLGVLVGAGLQYLFGRSMEVRRQVELSKALAYSDFLRGFASVGTRGKSNEVLAQLIDAKMRVCVYGAPKVIRLLGDFERQGAIARENMTLVSALVFAMREDAQVVSGMPTEADLGVILFGLDWEKTHLEREKGRVRP